MNNLFYYLKPIIPRRLQIFIRRKRAQFIKKRNSHIWPIDHSAFNLPKRWQGWPNQKKFALVLSHDVDSQKGHDRCIQLIKLEKELGFCSSFNFVPRKYRVSPVLRHQLETAGFEVGVHGLFHDGRLYQSYKIFIERAVQINKYIKKWGAVGFRSPMMHHNLEWLCELEIKYDLSTFDTDPFEPQTDGANNIFPFWVSNRNGGKGYVELPYTLAQDHLLFIILKEKSINIWKQKLNWIAKKGGMALVNVHPDYMAFNNKILNNEEYPAEYYQELLNYIKIKFKNKYFHALPKDICDFWTKNYRNY